MKLKLCVDPFINSGLIIDMKDRNLFESKSDVDEKGVCFIPTRETFIHTKGYWLEINNNGVVNYTGKGVARVGREEVFTSKCKERERSKLYENLKSFACAHHERKWRMRAKGVVFRKKQRLIWGLKGFLKTMTKIEGWKLMDEKSPPSLSLKIRKPSFETLPELPHFPSLPKMIDLDIKI